MEVSPSRLEAWKALASLGKASNDTDAIIRANTKLVRGGGGGTSPWLGRGSRLPGTSLEAEGTRVHLGNGDSG